MCLFLLQLPFSFISIIDFFLFLSFPSQFLFFYIFASHFLVFIYLYHIFQYLLSFYSTISNLFVSSFQNFLCLLFSSWLAFYAFSCLLSTSIVTFFHLASSLSWFTSSANKEEIIASYFSAFLEFRASYESHYDVRIYKCWVLQRKVFTLFWR